MAEQQEHMELKEHPKSSFTEVHQALDSFLENKNELRKILPYQAPDGQLITVMTKDADRVLLLEKLVRGTETESIYFPLNPLLVRARGGTDKIFVGTSIEMDYSDLTLWIYSHDRDLRTRYYQDMLVALCTLEEVEQYSPIGLRYTSKTRVTNHNLTDEPD